MLHTSYHGTTSCGQQEGRGAMLCPSHCPVPRSWMESSRSCFAPCAQVHTTCWILPWVGVLEQVPSMGPCPSIALTCKHKSSPLNWRSSQADKVLELVRR